MNYRPLIGSLIPAIVFLLSAPILADDTARGVVYHDKNGNQKFDSGDEPLPNVRVSNGQEIATTGEDGRYEIGVGDDTIIFVIKPRGWRTPIDEEKKLPRFYYIHKPGGSPELKYGGVEPTGPLPDSIDFPLYEQKEPEQFRAILFGDTQPRDQKEIDYIAHDVVEELIGSDALFGVTLGDVVFDRLDLFEQLSKTIALIGIPWYNVVGNHDINFDAADDETSDETFERVFGPAYYSFDYGPVHFLVLDDIEWFVPDGAGRGQYRGGFGARQIEFIKNDLAGIPEKQLVVLLMHIPLTDVRDRREVYRLIERRPFCMSVSGHTHYHEHRFITKEDGWEGPEPHHHIINVTVCGSWWTGQPDERGIPHATMSDGAPNGYSIISFDGTKYSIRYKAASQPASDQMHIVAPEEIAAGDAAETQVYVNIYNGSERSSVEMRVGDDGEWEAMTRTVEIDPLVKAMHAAEGKVENRPWRPLSSARPSAHLWKAPLPADLTSGTYLIQIRATDINGDLHHGRRVIRVNAEGQ